MLNWFGSFIRTVILEAIGVGFLVGLFYFLMKVITGGSYELDYWLNVQVWTGILVTIDVVYSIAKSI